MTKEFGYFLESNFFRANRLFALVYSNRNNNSKRLNNTKILFTKRHNQKLYHFHQWKKDL